MKLNQTISLIGYFEDSGRVCFECSCTMAEAVALDGQTLTVTEDGDEVAAYPGYSVTCVEAASVGTLRVWCARELDDATSQAIAGLEASVDGLRDDVAEAKEKAEQAGTSPSVRAASAMYVNAIAITNTQLGDVRDLVDDFVPGAAYAKGLVRRWDGAYYRMAKDIDAATSQTYQPGAGTESLYTLIDLAPDGVRVWHMPTCAEDSFALGERAHYPDADGHVYVSGRVGNTSTPGTDEWWTKEVN